MLNKILFAFLLSASTLFGAQVDWAKNYKSAMVSAKKLNKPVMFVSSRHTCKYCVILDETTFRDEKVVKALSRDYIAVTSYSDENDYMPRELYRPGTPAIWFLLPSGEPMFQPLMGAVDAPNFLNALAIVKEEFDKTKTAEKIAKK